MKILEKEKELEELNREIADKFFKPAKSDWLPGNFIPTFCKHQYRVMFIGQQPSKEFEKNPHKRFLGNYNVTGKDTMFKNQLIKTKLAGSYITDLVKRIGQAGEELKEKEIKKFIYYLKKEIKIINPSILVVMSDKVRKYLENSDISSEYKIIQISHPNSRGSVYKKWDREFRLL